LPDIRINTLKNRLTIVSNNWIPTDIPVFVRKLEAACLVLVPGFTCRAIVPYGSPENRRDGDFLRYTTDLITAYGAGKIVFLKGADAPRNRCAS
jgi:hypothetical protein